LNLSVNAIRKLAITDKNFPIIHKKEILTYRLMQWKDGGSAYEP